MLHKLTPHFILFTGNPYFGSDTTSEFPLTIVFTPRFVAYTEWNRWSYVYLLGKIKKVRIFFSFLLDFVANIDGPVGDRSRYFSPHFLRIYSPCVCAHNSVSDLLFPLHFKELMCLSYYSHGYMRKLTFLTGYCENSKTKPEDWQISRSDKSHATPAYVTKISWLWSRKLAVL